jgi:hypothetical protein
MAEVIFMVLSLRLGDKYTKSDVRGTWDSCNILSFQRELAGPSFGIFPEVIEMLKKQNSAIIKTAEAQRRREDEAPSLRPGLYHY